MADIIEIKKSDLQESTSKTTVNGGLSLTASVIPGLTRNPVFFWIPAFAGMTPLIPVIVAVYMSPFIRLLKNVPACAEASVGRQMQVELREIPFAGAPDNFKLEIPQPTFHNPKLP